jgi:hypothetical protein
MLRDIRHQFLQASTIVLVVFMLLGVQVIQASPLHDHAQQHSVDCALCHLQFGDDAAVRQAPALPVVAAVAAPVVALPGFYLSSTVSPYQGRAPPRFLS